MNQQFEERRAKFLAMGLKRKGKGPVFAPKPGLDPQFEKCPQCGMAVRKDQWSQGYNVCPGCGLHRPIGAYDRLRMLLDDGAFRECNSSLAGRDPLSFPGYREKLAALRTATGLKEAAVTAVGKIHGSPAVVAVMDSRFLMGSMGTAVGEKIARAAQLARKKKLPLIIFCASGGARMQEGILSLMQMAHTAAAIEEFQRCGGLYIACLTNPTTGGVSASFAMLGDITLAEPGALIGFAGPRVIEQTIGQKLPEGFQRAEFLQGHGFVDAVVPRGELRDTLGQLLSLHGRKR